MRRGRLWKRLSHEAKRLLPAWLFFFLAFSLLRLTQTAVLQEHGVRVLPPSKVFAGVLIVAKALLTVDSIKLFARLEGRSVFITALFKTFVYMLVVFFFEYSETLFEFRHDGFTAGNEEFARRLASMRFWVIQVWLVVLALPLQLHPHAPAAPRQARVPAALRRTLNRCRPSAAPVA